MPLCGDLLDILEHPNPGRYAGYGEVSPKRLAFAETSSWRGDRLRAGQRWGGARLDSSDATY